MRQFVITDQQNHEVGIEIQNARPTGDFNADGIDDFLVGAYSDDDGGAEAGAAYVLFGPVSGTVGLGSADAKFHGEAAGDQVSWPVAPAGDIDNDGTSDFLVGGYLEDTAGANAGATYLILAADHL